MLLHDHFRPITDTVGLFRCATSSCAEDYVAWMGPILSGGGSSLRMVPQGAGTLAEHLTELMPLTRVGITRALFLPIGDGWTACFTNGWRGTDMSSVVPMLSVRLGCEAIRLTCIPDLGRGSTRRYGARIVAVHQGHQKADRVISVVNDGGTWVEDVFGPLLPEEDAQWYEAARVRDRFKASDVRALVSRLVPGFWNVDGWPREGALLVERLGKLPPNFTDVALADAQRDIPAEPS